MCTMATAYNNIIIIGVFTTHMTTIAHRTVHRLDSNNPLKLKLKLLGTLKRTEY